MNAVCCSCQSAASFDQIDDRIRDLLQRPDSLQLQPAAYELVNDEGFNFAFVEEVTGSRTARVSIDFGNGTFEEYRIATNVCLNKLRTRRRHPEDPDSQLLAEIAGADDPSSRPEARSVLARLFQR